MSVDEDGARAVLNSATNHTRGGLREHKRGHSKIRNNAQDQARLHLCSLVPEVVPRSIRRLRPKSTEGYLPNSSRCSNERSRSIAFVEKKYSDAERWYGDVVARFANSHFAPEAMYWRAVAHYKATNDHTVMGKVAEELRNTYPSSVWASKATPWLH